MKILIRAVIYLLEGRLEDLEERRVQDASHRLFSEIQHVKSFISKLEEEV